MSRALRRRAVARAVALAVVALLASCSDGGSPGPSASASGDGVPRSVTGVPVDLPPVPEGGFDPVVTVHVDGAPPIRAEVARRPDQRARGLMQRRELPEDAGMVFLFPRPSSGGFHMLGTLIPLSIAYVDGDQVVSVVEMAPCPGQSCPVYAAAGPYTMAVEAPAGFFPAHGVTAGARVRVVGSTAPPT